MKIFANFNNIELSLIQDAVIAVLMRKQKIGEIDTIDYLQYEQLNAKINVIIRGM